MPIDQIQGIVNQDFINQQVEATKNLNGANGQAFDPNMFLKLLTTQLQNQSPFDTVDTSEILNTQATLAQVEQSAQQTKTMTGLQDTVNISLAGINFQLQQINAKL